MDSTSANAYLNLTNQLQSYNNIIPKDLITSFRHFTEIIYKSDLQDSYNQPVPWIGIYIALASLVCILAMMADLLHGFRNRIQWFPCKYFTLNSASLSMIAVAIKIPMDLTNLMPTRVDQVTKIGSMAFMCTMMVNSLPSLATMNNQQLLANVIALGVLVITLVVNVCIQIYTGVITYPESQDFVSLNKTMPIFADQNKVIASIYVVMLLLLLIIYTSSALAISESKRILEKKHQVAHETDLRCSKGDDLFNVGRLWLRVRMYWVMAKAVNPEFMTVCNATTCTSGVICVLSTILFTHHIAVHLGIDNHASDYKWSIPVIFLIQFIGVVLGMIAPLLRCFPPLYWKASATRIVYPYVFKVEKHWTRKLSDWGGLPFPFHIHKCNFVIANLRILNFSVCVWLQKSIVVACKMVALIPILFLLSLLFVFRLFHCMKKSRMDGPMELREIILHSQLDQMVDKRTMKQILTSWDKVIEKAENQHPKYLTELLKKSTRFEGMRNFYKQHLSGLTSMEYLECWSLSLVTMTTIATSLPDIPNYKVKSLLRSMSEGLSYVSLVEERLNATDEYARIQKAAKQLWQEVKVQHKWLGIHVKVGATTREILKWFNDTSNKIVISKGKLLSVIPYIEESKDMENTNWNTLYRCYCANSMYQSTHAVMLSYQDIIDKFSQEALFDRLSSLISEILAACLMNLPRVIVLECHANMTEEREASVHAAAQLLGRTARIIKNLKSRQRQDLKFDQWDDIRKWRAHFRDFVPA